jgi:hypothetical protein
MNLFILDNDLDKCAEYHVDSHVTKMQLEVAQLMCSAVWITHHFGFTPLAINADQRKFLNANKADGVTPYLPTHYNHPCAIWVRSSLDNFEWAFCYAQALNSEQHYRTGGTHKSYDVITTLPSPKIPRLGITPFAQAMPDEYKSDDAVQAYRDYYIFEKNHLAKWKHRGQPEWWPS